MIQSIRAVTFDVGGTLIEPWPSVGHVYAAVAAEHGFANLDPEILNRQFAAAWRAKKKFDHSPAAWRELVDAAFAGLTQSTESFFPELYERFGKPPSWKIFDDVFPCLDRLKRRGLKLGVISNWDERLRPLLRELRLAPFFEAIIISCEQGCLKPSPRIFEIASELFAVPPPAVLHVGDNRDEDFAGARSVGMSALLLNRHAQGGQNDIASLHKLLTD
ncbi:MAG: HAD family hydrolase [Verrucomicrobia bacterium]|nr:MAG: HAD family hydrolase [Verrucomicrobiota bacterium]